MDSQPKEMAKALEGVHGLFVITNFWEHFDYMREAAQAKAVVEAGEMAGVKHFVWSTLENTVPFFDATSSENQPPKVNGTYVPHFDGKGLANEYFPNDKSTILYTSFYLENLYQFGLVKNGVFQANLGDTKLPVIAVDDIGKCTYGIFKAGDKFKGESVYLAGDRLTVKDMMEIASDAIGGQPYSYKAVDRETYAGIGFPGSDDLANMFEYMRLNSKYGEALDPAQAKVLNSELMSVRSFFEMHKEEMMGVGQK